MDIKKPRVMPGEEKGSAMVIGAFGVILAVMFMALMMDIGLYYNSYRKLKAVTDSVDEEIKLMLPYYAYANDYVTSFNNSLDIALTNLGYSQDNVVRSDISRQTGISLTWVISVETDIELEDTYHCMFAFIIGINEIPIRVTNNTIQNIGIDEPYNGGPYEVWN